MVQYVKWVNFAMIDAEELGVTSKTIDDAMKSQKPEVQAPRRDGGRLRQTAWPLQRLGGHVVRAVGNYGEVFERNVGANSKLGIPRGLNELWNNGGIQYAPPIR